MNGIRQPMQYVLQTRWLILLLVISLIAAVVPSASAQTTNLALNKPVTGSIAIQNAAYITNGDKNTANFAGQESDPQWVRIDLGQSYSIGQIKVWHYFGDGRTYRDVIVQVSNSSTFSSGVTTVFNNDANNSAGQGVGSDAEYAETSAGKTITFSPVSARYVRLWINGSSSNQWNHYVEVEVFGAGSATATNTPVPPTATRTNTPVMPTATSSGSTNLVSNPEFDNGTNNWALGYWSGAAANWAVDTTSKLSGVNSARVNITNAGASGWQIQLRQPRPITSGKTYQITFMARATSNRTISVAIQKENDPWTTYYSQAVNITTNSATYGPYTYTANATVADANLEFYLGGSGTGTVYIDKVIMTDGSVGPTNTPAGPTATRTNTPVAPTATRTPTPTSTSSSVTHPAFELFDDFNYTSSTDSTLLNFGWVPRQELSSGPGPAGADFLASNISFVTDPANSSNRLMQLRTTTNGTGTGTKQAEIYTGTRKFLEGTYAARVRFTDAPISGSYDGDEIVQTFFTITPLNYPMDPLYSEIDFEYLSNGGWGQTGPTMWVTTWETYQPDPWIKDGVSDFRLGSFAGWHILVFTVGGGEVRYYLDGSLFAVHGGKYYPETPMSINFNQWIIPENFGGPSTSRTWLQEVDWVYFARNTVLTPAQVNALVADFRGQSIIRKDNVP